MKMVSVTIELTEGFVRGLVNNLTLSGAGNDPIRTLARGVMMEARGAEAHQVREAMAGDWSDDINVVHERRAVLEGQALRDFEVAKALINEITMRTVLEETHLDDEQRRVATNLVTAGRLRRVKMHHPTSGDTIWAFKP